MSLGDEKNDLFVRLDELQVNIPILTYHKFNPWIREVYKKVEGGDISLDEIIKCYYQFQAFYLSLKIQKIETITVWNCFETWEQMIGRRNLRPEFLILNYAENDVHLAEIIKAAHELITDQQYRYKEEIIGEMRESIDIHRRREKLPEFFLMNADGKCCDIIYALTDHEAQCIVAHRKQLSCPLVVDEFIGKELKSLCFVNESNELIEIFPLTN